MSSINPSDALYRFDAAVKNSTSAAYDIDDFPYSYWYKSYWGDLLQPAPMAIAIFGNLTLVAATTEFKLVAPKDGFEYILYPDSFRATISQLVDSGASALEQSYVKFGQLQQRCADVRPRVNDVAILLAGADAHSEEEMYNEIRIHLPDQVSRLQSSVVACRDKAKEMNTTLTDLLDLILEINESYTATQGTKDAKLADETMRHIILLKQKKTAEDNKTLAQDLAEQSRVTTKEAQKHFYTAADDIPATWGLVGLQFVDGFTQTTLSTVNGLFNKQVGESQKRTSRRSEAINQAGALRAPEILPVIPDNISDPGYQKAQLIRNCAIALESLATAGKDGGVDWEIVSSKDNSGAIWLRNQMQTYLDGTWTEDEPSNEAQTLLRTGIQLAQDLHDAAPTRNKETFDELVSQTQKLALDATIFATTAANKTGTALLRGPGFATSTRPAPSTSSSAIDMAIKNGQYKLEATQKQMDAADQLSQEYAKSLLDVTSQMGEVLGQISSLNPQNVDWVKIRQVLLHAIAFVSQIKGRIADIVLYLDAVNIVISISLNDAASQLNAIIQGGLGGTLNKSVGGVPLANWTRQVIHDQALFATKVIRLIEEISKVFIAIYERHVQDGVNKLRVLGRLMQGSANWTVLQKAAADIQSWAPGASDGIQQLIRTEQAQMQSNAEGRMRQLQQKIGGILPAPSSPVVQAIEDATHAHMEEVGNALTSVANNQPVFKPTLGIKV